MNRIEVSKIVTASYAIWLRGVEFLLGAYMTRGLSYPKFIGFGGSCFCTKDCTNSLRFELSNIIRNRFE